MSRRRATARRAAPARAAGWGTLSAMRRNPGLLLIFVFIVVFVAIWFLYTRTHLEKGGAPGPAVEAHIGPPDIYPDPIRTPGATNSDITQANIHETICNPRWSTRLVRPPSEYTNRLKVQQIREYGYSDFARKDYEEDHFIPLELGGSPTDPRNLWPEPFAASVRDGGAHYKDQVENYLHAEVCAGSLTLEQAQQEIIQDWYRIYSESVPH